MIVRYFAAALLALVFLAPPVAAQVTSIDPAAHPVDQPPLDFDFQRTGGGDLGTWVVVSDTSAQGGRAIAQTSTDDTNYRFPLAVFQKVTAADVQVTIRFKPMTGKVDQAGGIAVRLSSPDNYYVVRANALENNVRFYRVVNGERQQLADAQVKVTAKQWHTLSLKAEGNSFTVSFNDAQLFTTQDNTFSAPGKVALWTKADSVTHFDTIKIEVLN